MKFKNKNKLLVNKKQNQNWRKWLLVFVFTCYWQEYFPNAEIEVKINLKLLKAFIISNKQVQWNNIFINVS